MDSYSSRPQKKINPKVEELRHQRMSATLNTTFISSSCSPPPSNDDWPEATILVFILNKTISNDSPISSNLALERALSE